MNATRSHSRFRLERQHGGARRQRLERRQRPDRRPAFGLRLGGGDDGRLPAEQGRPPGLPAGGRCALHDARRRGRGKPADLAGTQPAYDPQSPYADGQGLVAQPNVDPVQETVNQIGALNAFKANVDVLKVSDEMQPQSLLAIA